MTNILPFTYSAPLPITALEVTIARANTAHGERFTVCAKDDKGNWQPLIKDPKLRKKFGRRGQALARHYSWDHIAHRVMSYYERILYEHTEVAASRARKPAPAARQDA